MALSTRTDAPPVALKRISWGAVFAGAVVAVVVGLVLNLLGLGVGLSTFEPATGDDSFSGLGTGQAIWFVISSLISLFVGGWVAGHLAGLPRRVDGLLHGIVAWGLTTLLTVYLVGSGIGNVLGGVTSLVGSGLTAAGAGIAAAAPGVADAAQEELDERGITLGTIRSEAEALLRDTENPALSPENLEAEADAALDDAQAGAEQAAQAPATTDLGDAFDNVFDRAEGIASEADREDLVNVITARTGQSDAEARQTIAEWEQTLDAARTQADTLGQRAAVAGEDAANVVGRGALAAFFALLLGGIAAAFGGGLGARYTFKEDYPEGHPYRTPYVTVHDDPTGTAR